MGCFFFILKLFGKVKKPKKITGSEMRSVAPKMMALIIAAYREEDVIEEVIRNLIASNLYPYEMYHIFIGVYPNDPATISIIEMLAKEYDYIHPVVHYLQGPSSKADNINNELAFTKNLRVIIKVKTNFM